MDGFVERARARADRTFSPRLSDMALHQETQEEIYCLKYCSANFRTFRERIGGEQYPDRRSIAHLCKLLLSFSSGMWSSCTFHPGPHQIYQAPLRVFLLLQLHLSLYAQPECKLLLDSGMWRKCKLLVHDTCNSPDFHSLWRIRGHFNPFIIIDTEFQYPHHPGNKPVHA